ncbi:hypothetical protein Hanom_Chr00s000004g01606621 [Helianthus anomalus]
MFFRNVLILLFNFKIKWVLGSVRACLFMFFETTYRLIGVLKKSVWSDLLTYRFFFLSHTPILSNIIL